MNNPINDIPYSSNEAQNGPIFRNTNAGLFDAFEHWLQGRVNLCVAGLQDQITRLEIRNNELVKRFDGMTTQIESLNIHIDADAAKVVELKNIVQPLIDKGVLSTDIKQLVRDEINGKLDEIDFTNYLDSSSLFRMIEDDVDEAIGSHIADSSVIGSAVEQWCDDNMDDKVRDCVSGLTFEVSVS